MPRLDPREGTKIENENEEILRVRCERTSPDESERGDVRFAGGWVAAGRVSPMWMGDVKPPARAANEAERRREDLRGGSDGMVQGAA